MIAGLRSQDAPVFCRMLSLVAVAVVCLLGPANASVIVNIDAVANATTTDGNTDDPSAVAIAVPLTAGTWAVERIGPLDGGTYTAWNAWGGAVGGCDSGGANCSVGWIHWYRIQSAEFPRMRLDNGIAYSTATAALANGIDTQFTISAPGTVYFFIFDTGPSDNVGGVSLRLTEVLEPASALILAAGISGIALTRRRLPRAA